MASKSKKRKEKRFNLFRLALAVFFLYLVVEILVTQFQISSTKDELNLVSGTIENQSLENDELQRILDLGDDSDYLERIARDKYNYVYPGERVFYDMGDE